MSRPFWKIFDIYHHAGTTGDDVPVAVVKTLWVMNLFPLPSLFQWSNWGFMAEP